MAISQITQPERLRAAKAAAEQRAIALNTPDAPPAPPREADGVSISDTARARAAARKADAVSISDSARTLAAARKAEAEAPATDVREDRVSALKAAIAGNTYTIDSRQLASLIAKQIER